MSQFRLDNEPWINVIDNQGIQRKVGIRQALNEAHLHKIVGDGFSRITLTYLLTLVCKRAYMAAKKALDLEVNQFDPYVINAYLDKWAFRFDLIHPSEPFGQCPGMGSSGRPKPIVEIMMALPCGNNGTLTFSGSQLPSSLSLGEAAIQMLKAQVFSCKQVANVQTAKRLGKTHKPPAVLGMLVLAEGVSLYDTMLSNFRWDILRERSLPPFWEIPPIPAEGDLGKASVPSEGGLLCRLPLRMLLSHEDGKINGVWWAAGHWVEVSGEAPTDLTVTREVTKDDETFHVPVRLSPERSALRDMSAIMAWIHGSRSVQVSKDRGDKIEYYLLVDAWSQAMDAKIRYAPEEHLCFGAKFAGEPKNIGSVQNAVQAAEAVARMIVKGIESENGPKGIRDSILCGYWSTLSVQFGELIARLQSLSSLPDGETDEQREGLSQKWMNECKSVAASLIADYLPSIYSACGRKSISVYRLMKALNCDNYAHGPIRRTASRRMSPKLPKFEKSLYSALSKPNGLAMLRRQERNMSHLIDMSESENVMRRIMGMLVHCPIKAASDIYGDRRGIGASIRRMSDDGWSSRIWPLVEARNAAEALEAIQPCVSRMYDMGIKPNWIKLTEDICGWTSSPPQNRWIEDFYEIDTHFVNPSSFSCLMRSLPSHLLSFLGNSGANPRLVAKAIGSEMPYLDSWDAKCCSIVGEAFGAAKGALGFGDMGRALKKIGDEERMENLVGQDGDVFLSFCRESLRICVSKNCPPDWEQLLTDMISWAPCWRRTGDGFGIGAKWVCSFYE